MPASPKRMLIDATHTEEMRVAIVDQNLKLEHLDIVHAGREPLKGNIYLARVRRIEPSLQAAFVEYDQDGEKRHGFLSFAEIHPDYFRIPEADRGALREALARVEERAAEAAARGERLDLGELDSMPPLTGFDPIDLGSDNDEDEEDGYSFGDPFQPIYLGQGHASFKPEGYETPGGQSSFAPLDGEHAAPATVEPQHNVLPDPLQDPLQDPAGDEARVPQHASGDYESAGEAAESGGAEDELEEQRRRVRRQFLRNYRIQEVVKRGQVMLIQVVKEERGNKGAALTTYMSLAGRYCVLMPNSDRSGGVSRKISNPGDRRRLKETLDALNMPDGVSVILRTAGVERSADEIKRDYDYLTRLWDQIRDAAFGAVAPALIYEEANLIKRAIRDQFARDVDGIVVQGDGAFAAARDFIRLLMPTHEDRVVKYENPVPLFTRYQIETQIETLYEPVVQLKSGGYLVINPTEALISIDVNSGRATRDRHIEDTALRTNLEAAEEVARQLKLRDFAGLVVIDFIDMEDGKHNQQVERKLKEATRGDRARLQIGRISGFGLLEMSRQRLRASLLETNFETCPHCAGAGMIRSADSAALAVLRAIEDEGLRGRAAELAIDLPTPVALYILGEKRAELERMRETYACRAYLRPDDSLLPHEFKLTVLEAAEGGRRESAVPAARGSQSGHAANDARRIFADGAAELGLAPLAADDLVEAEPGEATRRRRGSRDEGDDTSDGQEERPERDRNRRGRGRIRTRGPQTPDAAANASGESEDDAPGPVAEPDTGARDSGEDKAGRRRNRRGGRNRRGRSATGEPAAQNDNEAGVPVPARHMPREQASREQASREQAPREQVAGRQAHVKPQASSGRSRAAAPPFAKSAMLEIDTTPKKAGARGDKSAIADSADKPGLKLGWWRRWTGG